MLKLFNTHQPPYCVISTVKTSLLSLQFLNTYSYLNVSTLHHLYIFFLASLSLFLSSLSHVSLSLPLSLSPPSAMLPLCLSASLAPLRPASEWREAAVPRALSATYRRKAARDGQRARAQSESRLFPPLTSRESRGKHNKMESV